MKLIEMLVEELPKRGGWPEGAEIAVQDTFIDNDIKFGGKGCQTPTAEKERYGDIVWRSDEWNFNSDFDFATEQPARDYATAIITREQYESALAAKNDGWIEWGGGECPVEEGTLVDVKYRDGDDFPDALGVPALSGYGTGSAFWELDGYNNDIIAYRLHQPQEAEQTKANEEAGLNECIGQGAAPVWNGEGLPPVGCVCEVLYDEHEVLGNTWLKAKIISHDGGNVVGRWLEGNTEHTLFDYAINHRDYRQLRTEADKKRDAAIESLMQIVCGPSQASAIVNKLYDAIAAGEITGVKLED